MNAAVKTVLRDYLRVVARVFFIIAALSVWLGGLAAGLFTKIDQMSGNIAGIVIGIACGLIGLVIWIFAERLGDELRAASLLAESESSDLSS